MLGRVLSVAGSDSGGGAGIQADIKAVTALGGFCMTALTALTAQDTRGVRAVVPVDPGFVALQIGMAFDDPGVDAVKTGMLANAGIIRAVAVALERYPDVPLILDPVMVAKGGASLLDLDAVSALRDDLIPRAALVTPNVPEAEVLTGRPVRSVEDMVEAARVLRGDGAKAVLMKGGHLEGDVLTDVLVTDEGSACFSASRIETRHTHGTGCTLASAIAVGVAQGLALQDAYVRAHRYLRAAIVAAPGYGQGAGPLDHGVTIDAAWRV